MKRIDLYAFCYNDEAILPFYLAYYTKIVDRITLFDSASVDRTLEIIVEYAAKGKPEIRVIQTGHKLWDWDEAMIIRNDCWKDSDYELIMWNDVDEIIYRPDLREFLESTDFDIYQTIGYDMVSNVFPKPGTDILDIKLGSRAPLEDKYLIWKRGSKMFADTAHSIILPKGESVSKGEIKLLHYKYMGVDIMLKRAELIKRRVPADSFCKKIGGNILKRYPAFIKTRQEYIAEIARRMSQAVNVI